MLVMSLSATIDKTASRARTSTAVPLWLFACCAMIFAMVVIGGVTRLTESGLSIVKWQPIGGIVPPLSAADWQTLFEEYKASPQFRFMNAGMDVASFQTIFWWEYIHRVWGRLIGFVFLLPLVWFWMRSRLDRSLRWPLVGFFLLGGVQGAIGWWMVKSGLDNVPWVSPYRLTVHLGFALLLYSGLFWVGLSLVEGKRRPVIEGAERLRSLSKIAAGLVFLTVLAGGFVAGLRAGKIYNEFPLMGDGLIPPDYRDAALGFLPNMFENPAAAQFDHRLIAITTVLVVLGFWARAMMLVKSGPTRTLISAFALMALIQMTLGISTVLLVVPVWLAALHQAGAVTLLTLALWSAHRLRA
jgi:cytochrome c oxidase assembly protein subunit 15